MKNLNLLQKIVCYTHLIKYLKDSILDLVECCLCLSNVFYFSSIYIEGVRTKVFIFFLVVY